MRGRRVSRHPARPSARLVPLRPAAVFLFAVAISGISVWGCGPKPKYHTRSDEAASSPGSRPAPEIVGPGSPSRARVETAVRPWVGTPYRYGGVDERGVDCSGLVQNVLGELGAPLPRTVREQQRRGRRVDRDDLAPGDLVFFRLESGRIDHVGIALDANRFVHASSSRGVVIDRIMDRYFSRRLAEVRRVLEEGEGQS